MLIQIKKDRYLFSKIEVFLNFIDPEAILDLYNCRPLMFKRRSLRILSKLVLQILIGLFATSCTTLLYIAPKKVDCTGTSDQKCFLIRRSQTGNWIMHYQDIEGFDYELGFSYKIKVKKEKIKDSPLDVSTYRYVLVQVLEQRDMTDDLELNDLLGKEWILESLTWNGTQYGVEGQPPSLRFEQENKITGNGGCNKLFSSFTVEGRTISMNEIGSTRMMCEGKMELEEAFIDILGMKLRAIFDSGKLVLTSEGSNRMIFKQN